MSEASPGNRRGCRPWIAPCVLLAAVLVFDAAIVLGNLGASEKRAAPVFAAVAAALLAFATVLAVRGAHPGPRRFVGWFTIVLGASGPAQLAIVWYANRLFDGGPGPGYAVQIAALHAVFLIVTAVLRATRARPAAAWTTCAGIGLFFFVPVGTIVTYLWTFAARPRETSPS